MVAIVVIIAIIIIAAIAGYFTSTIHLILKSLTLAIQEINKHSYQKYIYNLSPEKNSKYSESSSYTILFKTFKSITKYQF